MNTFKQAKLALRAVGITLAWRGQWEEYRVNYISGLEATAYYTPDLTDAVDTGMAMAIWLRNRQEGKHKNA